MASILASLLYIYKSMRETCKVERSVADWL